MIIWAVLEAATGPLVFGCAYWRVVDETCSTTPLRCRHDERIEARVMDDLKEMVRGAYDRAIGLELSEVAVDRCITKAPCGGEKAGRSQLDRGKQGLKRLMIVDAEGTPSGW